MSKYTNKVVPKFDFTSALRLSVTERMSHCVNRVRERHTSEGTWGLFGVPPVPESGATETELLSLESELGVPLPSEFRAFLSRWRYLVIADGMNLWGFDHDGVSVGRPWSSDEHRAGVQYLVFADYWGYADGDQLLFEIGNPEAEVIAYLHEHGPLYEAFAPSFSLALWRLVEE